MRKYVRGGGIMDVETFRKLLAEGKTTRQLKARMRTSDIVQNIQSLINRHNKLYGSPSSPFPRLCKAFKAYNIFMGKVRPYRLKVNKGIYARLLEDLSFCEDLRNILKHFGMAQRGSKLTSRDQFQDSLVKAGPDFDLLSSTKIRLETLNLKQKIRDEVVVDSIIKKIYELFAHTNKLSESGGIKIASKTMHMIMPEVFIMIDNRVMESLHNISDYYPHQDDGSWYSVRASYSHKLNPYPGPGWDWYGCYAAALIYYKRIICEWCEKNNSDIQGFLNLDAKYGSTPARIIDKALW